ncbi:MAG: exo-alpha-sialidase, partial [Muribaculaceae bacterium]
EGTDIGSGDPALVNDRVRGTVLCIFTHGNGLWQSTPDNNGHIMVSKSTDDGRTWSRPVDINPQLYEGKSGWITSFAGSGHAVQLSTGRLMFVIQVRNDPKYTYGPLSCYACYSDDGGDTWHTSLNAADTNGDEAKIVELSDGRLMMSIRVRNSGYHRKFSYSSDGGVTWSAPVPHVQLVEPACNGDVISYTRPGKKPVLLHTLPFCATDRCNVSLIASYNDGLTWPLRQSIVPTGSGYSSITQMADGALGCLVESDTPRGYKLVFYRLEPTEAITKNESIKPNIQIK